MVGELEDSTTGSSPLLFSLTSNSYLRDVVGDCWWVNAEFGTFSVDPNDERKGTGLRFATDTLLSDSSGEACRIFTLGVLEEGTVG